jgi:PAS domain S-box-containing protein
VKETQPELTPALDRFSTGELRVSSELDRSLSLLRATLEATADGLLVVSDKGAITSYNQRFAEMWGIPEEVLASGRDEEALSYAIRQLKDPESFMAKVRDLYADPNAESFDTLEFSDGRVIERYSRPQRISNRTVGRVWSFRDITEQKRLESELAHQALHDSLTGLPNRALFMDHLARRSPGSSATRTWPR